MASASGNGKKWAAGSPGMSNSNRLSSPMKTAKPSTQSELEDMSRELSMAFAGSGEKASNEESSLFTKLIGINQEKVGNIWMVFFV